MTAPLDSRVIRITRWLLDNSQPRSTADLAADLGLSERVVRYRLDSVANYLASHDVALRRQRGIGISLDASEAQRERILDDLAARSKEPRVYTPAERERLLLDMLLWSYPATFALDRLNQDLEVSKTSARRDLRKCEPWLDRMGLPVVRRPGRGIAILGTEQAVRRALVQLFVEAVPEDVLLELLHTDFDAANLIRIKIPAGLRDRFASLGIREASEALASSGIGRSLEIANSHLIFTLYLAVSQARFADGHEIELTAGQFTSLRDHPAAEGLRQVAGSLRASGAQPLPELELAGLTEYLLGLGALTDVAPASRDHAKLLETILQTASDRINPALAEDEELRRSLSMHLSRVAVRLRYGLPVHNPLLAEVAERYPDVHAVSLELEGIVSEHMGAAVHDDELGFITMYLSGALERAHLKPRKNALVVCPSGMATAWVLVSRLKAEFPGLALAEVLSKVGYETADLSEFDLVISTVKLDESSIPVLVVNPLLSSADLRRISNYV